MKRPYGNAAKITDSQIEQVVTARRKVVRAETELQELVVHYITFEAWPERHAAEIAGVSRATIRKWVAQTSLRDPWMNLYQPPIAD